MRTLFVLGKGGVGKNGGLAGDRFTAGISRLLMRAAGPRLLGEVAELFELSHQMLEPLVERARAMEALLHDGRTGFVVVSTADARAVEESGRLIAGLPRLGLRPSALVFNRLSIAAAPSDAGGPERLMAGLADLGVAPDHARWMRDNLACHGVRARGEALRMASLEAQCGPQILRARLPELDRDVHDLPALLRLAQRLG